MSFSRRSAAVVAAWIAASLVARAQDSRNFEQRLQEVQSRYEARIQALEDQVRGLLSSAAEHDAAAQSEKVDQQVERQVGVLLGSGAMGRLDQTTRYDNRFNPAIGVVGDFVFVASGQRDSFDFHDQFDHRGAEVNILGRIDPSAYYAAVIHARPDSVELEEAYGVVDQGLIDTLSLRAGKFHYDFGKLGPVHAHELPFVDTPAVFQDYFGGSPIGTGLELHHWFGIGDVPIRWSVGVMNGPEGDAEPVVGPLAGAEEGGESAPAFGRRSIENFAYHARVTTLFDVAENHSLQLGTSAMWAPEATAFEVDAMDPDATIKRTFEDLILGLDLTYQWQDPSRPEWFVFGGEVLYSDQDFIDDASTTVVRKDALGFYVFAEFGFDQHWSIGGFFDRVERAFDRDKLWVGGGVFVTWKIDEFNRVRLQTEYVSDELLADEYVAVMLQWTTLIGSHAHPLNW